MSHCACQPTTITLVGSQTGISSAGAAVVRCDNASTLTIHGLGAGCDGQPLTLISVGAGQVDLVNQSATEAIAANRIVAGVNGTASLSPGSGRASLVYDSASGRWRLIEHEQGAWITPPFNASDYSANGSMTWIVDAADVTTCAFRLRGRTLTVALTIQASTIAGTPSTVLRRTIPGGFTSAKWMNFNYRTQDNAVLRADGIAQVDAGTSTMLFLKDSTGATNWTGGTNNCGVFGVFTFEVQ